MIFWCKRCTKKQTNEDIYEDYTLYPAIPNKTNMKKMTTAEIARINGKTVCALYTFEPSLENELAFNRDDLLKVYDNFDQPWLTAVNTRTGETGLIPHNYVTDDINIAGALSAWYPVNRIEAEKRLLLPGIEIGTYLIRPSRGKSTSVQLSPLIHA